MVLCYFNAKEKCDITANDKSLKLAKFKCSNKLKLQFIID